MTKKCEIFCGDCFHLLQEHVGNNTVDLTVTSPPYSGMRDHNGVVGWNLSCVSEFSSLLYQKTAPGGVCVWVIGDKTKNGSESGEGFKTALLFMGSGWKLNDTMIWRKTNAMPQVK